MRLRLQFSKGEAVRYISHLDLARVFERAVRRAKLPVAMSEGFNPHMKVAYASALSVGVTSDCEYVDIEMRSAVPAQEMVAALKQQLPAGLTLVESRIIEQPSAALMALVNIADYIITAPLQKDTTAEQLLEILGRFLSAQSACFVRHSPKGNKTIDVRPLIDTITLTACSAQGAAFFLRSYITDKGTVKPHEVMQLLVEQFGLPLAGSNPVVHRSGLYIQRDGILLSPLDVIR